MRGRDVLTVSDFGGTFANRLTLLVSVRSPLGGPISGRSSRTSRELPDVGNEAVDVGDGDDDGVDTDVSCVVTLALVMLEGVVYPESRCSKFRRA
jgi:hypothetical protein